MTESSPALHCGVVALVGSANTGKSSLLNALLAEKVSIVSPVAQTTRTLVRGILHDARGQLVLLDTPGLHRAESDLGRRMNRIGRAAVNGADVILLMFDASQRPQTEDHGWMKYLRRPELSAARRVFVLNKKDLGGRHAADFRALWAREVAGANEPEPFWIEISALTGEGVHALVEHLFQAVPQGEPLFPPDVLTDFPRMIFIADVIREKLFLRLHEELPHRVAVWVPEVVEAEDGSWDVPAEIYVERSSQKGILIGYKGRFLRAVRRAAEAELQNVYERPVRLDLVVKVEPNWTRNHWFLQRLGYVE